MGNISAQTTRYSHLKTGLLMLAMLLFSAGIASAGTVITQCDDCHGMPPKDDAVRKANPSFRSYSAATVGNHQTHLSAAPTAADCTACHAAVADTAFDHQNEVIKMANSIKGYSSASIRAKYNKGVFFNQTSMPELNSTATCSSVNCHFEATTPIWGATKFSTSTDCSVCHSVPGSSVPHSKHNEYYNFSDNGCIRCHADHLTGLNFNHATSAGGRGINVALDDGAYSGTGLNYLPSQSGRSFGDCSSNYCHSNGKNGAPNVTPKWGGSGIGSTLDCSGCHGNASSTGGAALYGRHDKHVNNAAYLGTNFACIDCHANTVIDNATIKDKSKHVNSFVDYSGSKAGQNFSDCSNIYCHSDGKDTHVNPGLWTSAERTLDCKLCHGSSTTAQGAAFNSVAGEPNYANGGAGAAKANSHQKHVNSVTGAASCVKCHSSTTTTGTAITGGSTAHIDGAITVAQGGGATFTYLSGDKSCTTSSCHSGGGIITSPPVSQWGSTFTCISCHGDAASGTLSGKHAAHVNNAAVIGTNFGCVECHAKTVSSNTTISSPVNHLNSFVDYSGVKAGKSTTYATATGVCSATYCHSDGKGNAKSMAADNWKAATALDCKGCHGSATSSAAGEPNYASGLAGSLTANSHGKHTTSGVASCANCHSATTLTGTTIVTGSSSHINQAFNVGSNGVLTISYDTGTKTCSATYCHSNVQAPGGVGAATVNSSPVWGGSAVNCASCHVNMSILPETAEGLALGSHKRHVTDAAISCSACHGTGFSATAVGPLHADGSINVTFTGKGTGTTYSQGSGNVPGDGYGTCSTSKCHGRATRNWGLNTTVPTCEKCHGSAATALTGTFKDTAGSTGSVYVGTHVSHLAGIHNYSSPITCDQCHAVPATVTSFGHMSSMPAPLTWGALARNPSHLRGGGVSTAMVPTYSGAAGGRTCSNNYCHAGVQDYSGGIYTPQGAGSSPAWGDPAYLGGSGCNKCHGYPPVGPAGSVHSASNNCNACHNHVAASNIAFNDKTKHINGIVETTKDECLGCHSTTNACVAGDLSCVTQKLVGAHISHTDADLFLVGKKLSTGDYTDPSWIYGIKYVKGFPKYGCGFCHPMNAGTHKNTIVELDLDPTHSQAGTVKNKNKTGGPWSVVTSGTSVVCSNVYCHSNGFVSLATNSYQYKTTPNWYATNPWASVDKCAQCHGNSPNAGGIAGSPAHAGHTVANHYKDVYSNYSGKLAVAGAVGSGAVHGDPATSTTFNCNLCHFTTVKSSFNDKGSVCVDCHVASGSAPLKGTMDVYSSNTNHVNGVVDVSFMDPFVLKSKAQLRDSITTVSQLNTSWTRVKGFKNISSYDLSRTTPKYTGGTCSTVACHNGTKMEWSTPGPLLCAACHVDLPM